MMMAKQTAILPYQLHVLQAIPEAMAVTEYPNGRVLPKLNTMYVGMRLPGGWVMPHDPMAPLKHISVHCSAAVPHKLAAALAMIEWLSAVHGRAGLALLRAAPPTQG